MNHKISFTILTDEARISDFITLVKENFNRVIEVTTKDVPLFLPYDLTGSQSKVYYHPGHLITLIYDRLFDLECLKNEVLHFVSSRVYVDQDGRLDVWENEA